MVLKTLDGREYHAHFWHHPVELDPKRRRKGGLHLMTEVRLHPGPCRFAEEAAVPNGPKRRMGPCLVESVHGEGRQHSRLDVFDKKIGRAVALDRALKGVTGEFLPREIRKQLWESYKNQANLPASNGTKL